MDPARQQRNGAQLPVAYVSRDGRYLESDKTNPARRGNRKRDIGAAERENQAEILQAELHGQALVRLGIEDIKLHLAGQLALGGVVHDDLDPCLVGFAQEAGKIGTHHEILEALRLFLQASSIEAARHGVHPDVPRGDRVGHGEFEARGAVRVGSELRLPERGLGELAAQLHLWLHNNRRGILPFPFILVKRIHFCDSRALDGHAALTAEAANSAVLAKCGAAGGETPARPSYAVTVVKLQAVGDERMIVGQRHQVIHQRPGLALPKVGRQVREGRPCGIDRDRVGRVVRGENVQALVIHVREQLGRASLHVRAGRALDAHAPGLLRSGAQLVAESGKLQFELLVVPRHKNGDVETHQLIVAQYGEPGAEPAAIGFLYRYLDERGVPPGDQAPALDEPSVAPQLEEDHLVRESRMGQESRLFADCQRGLFRHEQRRQRKRCLLPRNDEVL